MNGKWYKNGLELYREIRKNGWALETGVHDGILMPEVWEKKEDNGEWVYKAAYDGFGKMIGPNGEKLMKLW